MTLTARGLRREFRGRVAVERADIEMHAGRITGLIGPNGAGKTTLLLMLAGLLAADAGTVELDDAPVAPGRLRARVGWMPDVFGTWDSLTAAEILTTFARLYGCDAATAKRRAAELLHLVHLTEYADRPAQELSRGQKQRLGFARALVHGPAVLLLDEPASGMDPRSRAELRDTLRWVADSGAAVLVSSHILGELEEMVDEVVLMQGGRTLSGPTAADATWRVRVLGDPVPRVLRFPDDGAAAAHLAELVAQGVPVVEFTRSGGLEEAYLALDAERI